MEYLFAATAVLGLAAAAACGWCVFDAMRRSKPVPLPRHRRVSASDWLRWDEDERLAREELERVKSQRGAKP